MTRPVYRPGGAADQAAQRRAAIDAVNAQAAAEAQKVADRAALAEEAKRLTGKGRKR